ncbi:MAG: DUF3971 domain-containing protein, partial [Acetobacteraceae bacterium]
MARFALVIAKVTGGVAVMALLTALALAARLAVGPLDIGFLKPRIEAAIEPGPRGPSVAIGAAHLDWQGFRHGLSSPFLLTLDNVTLTSRNGAGLATILQAKVALSPFKLLTGRIVPRRIVIEQPRIVAVRSPKGGLALAFGDSTTRAPPNPSTAGLAGQILAALSVPPGAGARQFRELRQLRTLDIDQARLTVVDQVLGTTWQVRDANLTLERGPAGGLSGAAAITFALDRKPTRLSMLLHLQNEQLGIEAQLSPVEAGELAEAAPKLASFASLHAPVGVRLDLRLGAGFTIEHLSLEANVGSGELALGGGSVPIRGATLAIGAHKDTVSLRHIVVHLRGPGGLAGPTLSGNGDAIRDAKGRWRGNVSLTLDAVQMADLARYWPPDIARGGRAWITKNVTSGTARNGAIAFGFSVAPGTRRFGLTHVSGRISATGLVVHWLRPLPPATGGEVELSMTEPNAFTVHVRHAREGRLIVQRGEVVVTGLDEPDQNGAVTARIIGPLNAALALLAAPRLNLLAHEKLPLKGATGRVEANLTVALPLLKNVTMGAAIVHTHAQLSSVRIPKVFGRYGLDHGMLAVSVDNNGLRLSGRGAFAGIPARLSARMDFRAGPPNEIVEKVGAEASVTGKTLPRLGLAGAGAFVQGPIALAANLAWERNGR